LLAIYNFVESPYRDSVFDIYCIHNSYSEYRQKKAYVKIDPSYPWTQYWMNYNIQTGIPELDSLTIPYSFTIHSFPSSNVYKLETDQIINMRAFCDSISNFDGIIYAEIVPTIGDGNKILYTDYGSSKLFEFVIGMGDCPSGCTQHHILKFSVSSTNIPAFGGVYSNVTSPIWEPNCNITTGISLQKEQKFSCTIFPNPFFNETTIKFETNLTNANISICNLNGIEIIRFEDVNEKELSISRNGLVSGIYVICISDRSGLVYKQKLIVID
jgi:hypothetical protein